MKSCIFRNRHNLIFWLIAAPANNKCSLMECENKHMPWAKINSVYSTIDSNNCFTCENPRTIIHNVLLFLLLSILLQPSYALNIQGFLLYYLNVDIFLIVKHVSCIFTKKHMVPRVHFLKNKVQESFITSIVGTILFLCSSIQGYPQLSSERNLHPEGIEAQEYR